MLNDASLEALGKNSTFRLKQLAERCSPKVREKIQDAGNKVDVGGLTKQVLVLIKELANSKDPLKVS